MPLLSVGHYYVNSFKILAEHDQLQQSKYSPLVRGVMCFTSSSLFIIYIFYLVCNHMGC